MKKAVVYIHGRGGKPSEAKHYEPLFPDCEVIGFDYKSMYPWEAQVEFPSFFKELEDRFDSFIVIANSIGAFFSLSSLSGLNIEKVYFISPIVNMQKLMSYGMKKAGVTEEELRAKERIETTFGETLEMHYLTWVREHPINWNIPTTIAYGTKDEYQSIETIREFSEKYGADVAVMEDGEHWFHTEEQMAFLDKWILNS